MESIMLYRTVVQWGNLSREHKSWSKSAAIAWLYQYPRTDALGVVKPVWSNKIIRARGECVVERNR
jgi:hypothetical protein